MPRDAETADTILIVDDEESVRKTFQEWLESADLSASGISAGPGAAPAASSCRILVAADAEAALVLADKHVIDLAILDWNLGAGNDGLKLLEDLYVFNPDVVAIMITGYAHEATPLDAMRMGIRDYLDKNQDLDRDNFLRVVRRQLERIRPAKRERRLHQSLVAFREAVAKVLPLVQSAAALNDPVPLPEAIRSLFRFLLRTTRARDGVLLVRSYPYPYPPAGSQGDEGQEATETCQVYDAAGARLEVDLIPFGRSVAGTAISLQEPCAMNDLGQAMGAGSIELQPFERGRRSLLAAPLGVAPGIHVVLELFDKQAPQEGKIALGGFTEEDRRLVGAAADFGAEMLRQALAERQTHQVLLDAVAAALGASESVAQSLGGTPEQRLQEPPPAAVLDRLRQGLSTAPAAAADADMTLRFAEAVRVLALRHGAPAIRHCIRLVENLRQLLDTVTGATEAESPRATGSAADSEADSRTRTRPGGRTPSQGGGEAP